MTRPPAGMTVEQLVAQIRRSGLFAETDVRALEERWQREAGDTADARRFTRWLVARQYLTEPEANLLVHGQWGPATTASPAVPVAQAPPERGAATILNAVIVAPAANPRPNRSTVPTATAARPESAPPAEPALTAEFVDAPADQPPTPPAEPEINVELVTLPRTAASAAATAPPELEISVELVALTEPPALTSIEQRPVTTPVNATNVWLYLFLGALGLLLAQLAGWVCAHLLALAGS